MGTPSESVEVDLRLPLRDDDRQDPTKRLKLVKALEATLSSRTDEVDAHLRGDLEELLAKTQNKEWAEMLDSASVDARVEDFVLDVKGDNNSF